MRKHSILTLAVIIFTLFYSIKSYAQSATNEKVRFVSSVDRMQISQAVKWDGKDWKLLGALMKPTATTLVEYNNALYEAGGFTNPDGSTSTYFKRIKSNTESATPEAEENFIEKIESSVKVYPNPFSTSATFSIQTDKASAITVTLYDLLGREVKQTKTIKINRDNLLPGIYIYRINDNNGLIGTGQVVIN